jgi:Ca-activated chloride channel family protein
MRLAASIGALALLGGVAPAGADSAAHLLIEQGHAHYQAGRYQEALAAFEQIAEEGNERILPELLHDKAAALFKLGRLDDARELWVRAAGLRDAAFEAQSRYNIGNCHYEKALEAASADPPQAPAALKLLDEAVAQYRDALRLDPRNANARANLELAARLKKQIEEQPPPQSQPQSQPSSQPNQDQQDEQDPDQQQGPQSQPSDQNDQQRQPQDDDQQDPNSQQQRPQPDPNDPNRQQDPNAPQPQPQAPQDDDADEQPPPPEVRMSPEEAQRLLQMIRDAEKARREALRARQRIRPVDKDW